MDALPLPGDYLYKAEMEYNGKFGHTLGRIQHINLMSIIEICYKSCHISTKTMAPTITVFQGINNCIQYLDSPPQKPIFYPFNYDDQSYVIILTWSGNQVEDYTTKNCL